MQHQRQFTWLKPIAASCLSICLGACGSVEQAGSKSSVKVTNGREISETEYPSVVLIAMQTPEGVANCTATFVNDSQVVSAAHCVEGTDSEAPELFLVKQEVVDGKVEMVALAKATKWVRNPRYKFRDGVSGNDLSVITFPAKTAPASSKLAKLPAKVGDALTIVGYGNNRNFLDNSGQLNGSGAGTKRLGSNTVHNLAEGLIQFVGTPVEKEGVALGTFALSGSGDSGGPLFINGKLAGITSGGGAGETPDGKKIFISDYVDLASKESQQLLKTALKAGTF